MADASLQPLLEEAEAWYARYAELAAVQRRTSTG
jgi:hypothetical protein